MANYCKYCGNQLRDNAAFCPMCGKKTTAFTDDLNHSRVRNFFSQQDEDVQTSAVNIDCESVVLKKKSSAKDIIPLISAVVIFLFIAAAAFGNNLFGFSASAETEVTQHTENSQPVIYEKIEKAFNNQTPEILVSQTSSVTINSPRFNNSGELKSEYTDKINQINDYFEDQLGDEYTICIEADKSRLSDEKTNELLMNLGYNSLKSDRLSDEIKSVKAIKGILIASNGIENAEVEFEAFTLSEANKTKLISMNIDIPDAA